MAGGDHVVLSVLPARPAHHHGLSTTAFAFTCARAFALGHNHNFFDNDWLFVDRILWEMMMMVTTLPFTFALSFGSYNFCNWRLGPDVGRRNRDGLPFWSGWTSYNGLHRHWRWWKCW